MKTFQQFCEDATTTGPIAARREVIRNRTDQKSQEIKDAQMQAQQEQQRASQERAQELKQEQQQNALERQNAIFANEISNLRQQINDIEQAPQTVVGDPQEPQNIQKQQQQQQKKLSLMQRIQQIQQQQRVKQNQQKQQ